MKRNIYKKWEKKKKEENNIENTFDIMIIKK